MHQEIKIPSGTLSYLKIGWGRPLIVLNGYGGNFYTWPSAFKEELGKKFELYFINYREIGFSVAHTPDYTIPLLAQDVIYFIESLQLKDISLLGFSMGGYVAQEMALNYKEKISLFILCATKIGGEKAVKADPQIFHQGRYASLEEEIESDLSLNYPEDQHDKFREYQYERHRLRSLPEGLVSVETRTKQSHAIGHWSANFSKETYGKYAQFNVGKTLIFAGLKDKIIPYQNSIILSEHIKNSSVVLFDNGGHGLLAQYGNEIANTVGHW